MGKLNLKNVTLCAVACTKVKETIYALKKSMEGIEYARVVLLTHEKLFLGNIGIEVIPIERLDYKGYNYFILYKLKDYIETDFVLIVQNDGYVLRPKKWMREFLEYDYIGAPWPIGTHFTKDGTNVRVGNGGFSLRSKKLLNSFTSLGLLFTDEGTGFFHEDGNICVYHRKALEKNDVRFAPVSIASHFSRERWCLDSERYPFGFHSNRKNIFRLFYNKLYKK